MGLRAMGMGKNAAEGVESAGPATVEDVSGRSSALAFPALAAWCGLVAGWMEVGAFAAHKYGFDTNRLLETTHHFLWMVPAANLCVFLALGLAGSAATRLAPRRGRFLARRGLAGLTVLPALLAGFPRVHGLAWLTVALGAATWLVPALERRRAGLTRLVRASFPIVAGAVPSAALALWASDAIGQWRAERRPMPAPGTPNVLLIVLDTVAAGHLGLHGYQRPTSPTLDELAARGVRFRSAQAAAPWTLPSHATMFTGRWPHELSAGWLTPLDKTWPTLAEHLNRRGHATAGFVANTQYCAVGSGLERGFTSYRDYIFPNLTALGTAALVERATTGLQAAAHWCARRIDENIPTSFADHLWWLAHSGRKDATVVRREFLDWLSRRGKSAGGAAPARPFFAFLNFYDAHYPYQLPERSARRFGAAPRDRHESELIQNWWETDKRGLSARDLAFVEASYDDCVADLDEQLGCLVDELERRGVLARTWLIVVADHGESFGEHPGTFAHGTSLYQTELHVPLVIVPPAARSELAGRVVDTTVSLRDIAATVADLAGEPAGPIFPGASLARFWNGPAASDPSGQALAEVVPNDPTRGLDRSALLHPDATLSALIENEWSYIRRDGAGPFERLFHRRADPREQRDLARTPESHAHLERLRAAIQRLMARPPAPERARP